MRYLILIFLMLASKVVYSQDSLRINRKNVVSLAYLFPNPGRIMLKNDMMYQINNLKHSGISNTADIHYSVRGFGPVFFRSEHLITKNYGLGPVFGYSRAYITHEFIPSGLTNQGMTLHTNNYYELRYGMQSFTFGLRNTFYLKKKEKSETYFSLSLGYTHAVEEISDFYPSNYFIHIPTMYNPWFNSGPDFLLDVYHPLYWAFSFGFREYFSENAGLFAELGIDKWSFLQVGFFIRSRK